MASKRGYEQLSIRVKGRPKCVIHQQNDAKLLCQDCQMMICITCALSSHKLHIDSFQELTEIETHEKNITQDIVIQTDNASIPKLNQELSSCQTEMSSCKPLFKKLRKDIIDNNNQSKLRLDKITENYLSICDKLEVANTDLIQTHITDLERRLDTLKKLHEDHKQTQQKGTDELACDSESKIQEMDSNIQSTPDIDTTELTPNMDRHSNLKQAIGTINTPSNHLQTGPANCGHSGQSPVVQSKQLTETGQASSQEGRYKLHDRPTVMSDFSSPDIIISICPTYDGRAWLCYLLEKKVELISNEGQVIQTIHHNSYIRNISLHPTTGRLWFCCYDDRTICEVSPPSSPVTRFTTEDVPRSLCVTREDQVVVGAGGLQEFKVVMYTEDGLVLHTDMVEVSGRGYVRSITQCSVTGNIAVMSSKLIIVFNQTLQPLVHYRGEGIQVQKSVSQDEFYPHRVVYDSRGNIVIADWARKTIELISGTGKYIKTLHTNKVYQGPVGIQKGDVLWTYLQLGTGERGLKLFKYYSD
ncbi:uncharacterized protein LOC117339348 [Pecten maximus]|uniref:uncharacterized protein LOC117339348 n=1 Tax=Pecten maximus TaxID=6579 RepID=UPI001458CA99|nr:uncharacterized protein LOC117339348 [Pecten maximus]